MQKSMMQNFCDNLLGFVVWIFYRDLFLMHSILIFYVYMLSIYLPLVIVTMYPSIYLFIFQPLEAAAIYPSIYLSTSRDCHYLSI